MERSGGSDPKRSRKRRVAESGDKKIRKSSRLGGVKNSKSNQLEKTFEFMDYQDAAWWSNFRKICAENTQAHKSPPPDTSWSSDEESEAMKEKLKGSVITTGSYACPVCKTLHYKCNHYEYDEFWEKYTLIYCFVCGKEGEHWGDACPNEKAFNIEENPVLEDDYKRGKGKATLMSHTPRKTEFRD